MKGMKKALLAVSVAAFTAAVAPYAFAADNGIYQLGEISVSTTGETESSSVSKTVYRDQFDNAAVDSVADALTLMPGVNYAVGTRNEKNIYVRGFSQRQVPIYFDGIPVYLPYDGYVDMGKYSLSSIGMIELQTTAPSVQYGSNAMGGAINLVSRKPQKELEAEFTTEFGRNNNFVSSLLLGTKQKNFYAMFTGDYQDSEGYNMSGDFRANSKENGKVRDNSYRYSTSGNAKVGYTPTDGTEISLGYNFIRSDWGLPSNADMSMNSRYWRFTDWDKTTYYMIAEKKASDYGVKARVYRDEYYNVLNSYDNDSYNTQTTRKAFQSIYDDYSEGVILGYTNTMLKSNDLSFSLQYKRDQHKQQGSKNAPWLTYEMDTWYAGAEDTIAVTQKSDLTLSLAYDKNKPVSADKEDGSSASDLRDSVDTWSPKARYEYRVSDATKLHAAAAQTTRFPTLKEMYSTFMDTSYVKNPDLKEEKANNYEIGLTQAIGNFSLQTNLFYSDVKDLIEQGTVTVGGTTAKQMQNVDSADIRGIEAYLNGVAGQHEISGAYTYMISKNTSDDRTTDKLVDRPENMLTATDKYNINKQVYLAGTVHLETSRYTSDNVTVAGEYTADAKVGYKPTKNVTLEAGVDNMFDKNYVYQVGFPREGTYYYTKLSLKL